MQPQRDTIGPPPQWTGLATWPDKFWYLVTMCWLGVCTFGTMFVSAAFLLPFVLGVSNCTPRDTVGEIVEPVLLFGGMGVGMLVGLAGMSFICRRLMSPATHANWARQYEKMTLPNSALLAKLTFHYYKSLLPADWPSLRNR